MGILAKLFIKDYKNTSDNVVRNKYGMLTSITGITINILLFVIKLIASVLTSSISIAADAFNNLSDAGSSIITYVGFYLSGKPADEDHPFGHGRAEYICSVFVSTAEVESSRTRIFGFLSNALAIHNLCF